MVSKDRRRFIQSIATTCAVAPVITTALTSKAQASDSLPLLDPEAPAAKGLQYTAVAADENVNCKSCSLYTDDGSGVAGKCTIFPTNSVPAEAWCVAYQPRS